MSQRANIFYFLFVALSTLFSTLLLSFVGSLSISTILPKEENIPCIEVDPTKYLNASTEHIFDWKYYAYPKWFLLQKLDEACYHAYALMQKFNMSYHEDDFDCEDIAELILSMLRLRVNNPACFVYVYFYKAQNETTGHALLACLAIENETVVKFFYDNNCTYYNKINKDIIKTIIIS